MHDCLAVSAELANPYWFYPRVLVHRQTCRHAQPTPTQPALFPCGDDRWVYFVIFVADQKPWQALVEWIDTKGLAVDLARPARTTTRRTGRRTSRHIQEIVEVFFLLQTAEEAYHDGQARGLPIGADQRARRPARTTSTCWRGSFFVTVEHDDVPPAPLPGRAVPLLRASARAAPDPRAAARRAHRRGARLSRVGPASRRRT